MSHGVRKAISDAQSTQNRRYCVIWGVRNVRKRPNRTIRTCRVALSELSGVSIDTGHSDTPDRSKPEPVGMTYGHQSARSPGRFP